MINSLHYENTDYYNYLYFTINKFKSNFHNKKVKDKENLKNTLHRELYNLLDHIITFEIYIVDAWCSKSTFKLLKTPSNIRYNFLLQELITILNINGIMHQRCGALRMTTPDNANKLFKIDKVMNF